jgi:putative protein-disulfide isomerase
LRKTNLISKGSSWLFNSRFAFSPRLKMFEKSDSAYEGALLKLVPTISKTQYVKTWGFVFSKYHSLTAKEYSELTGTDRKESEKHLDSLVMEGNLEKLSTKNGAIWTLKKNI